MQRDVAVRLQPEALCRPRTAEVVVVDMGTRLAVVGPGQTLLRMLQHLLADRLEILDALAVLGEGGRVVGLA